MTAVGLALCLAGAGKTHAQTVDLTPAFFNALSAPTPEGRVAKLRADVIDRAPDLYGPVIQTPDDAALASYLKNLAPLQSDMKQLSEALMAEIPKAQRNLKRDLGQLKPAKIYVAPSLFSSNGQVRMSDHGPIVAFGPDVQAYVVRNLLDQQPPFDVRALAAHELFHAQHYARNQQMGQMANRLFGADRPPLFFNLWIEGLATCESMRLDGDGKAVDALMSQQLAALTSADVHRLAKALGEQLASTNEADYKDFFWMSGERQGVPKRAAYAVGSLVADRVIARQGLTRAVMLEGEPLRLAVAQALDAIASEEFALDWDRVCRR